MKPAPFEFARARNLDEAVRLLGASAGEARPYAGGQSLGPMLNFRLARPRLLVDISKIDALGAVEADEGGVTVGATTVHADFEDGVVPDVANGLLRRAASGIAYRAVRNRGTLGGSLAHADPAADWPPVMIALDASIRFRNAAGDHETTASEFVTGNLTTVLEQGDVIRSIRIPRLSPGGRWGHCKICVKPGDFAESLCVVVLDPPRHRVVLAGPATPPLRLAGVEELIVGAEGWSSALAESLKAKAGEEVRRSGFVEKDDHYAVNLHGTAVARAAREAMNR